MTPKLLRPYILQPLQNGIALFPLDDVKNNALDFKNIRVFTDLEGTYDYCNNPDKLLCAIRELVENGEEQDIPHLIPIPKNSEDS